jgi:hypothetical protein
MEEVLHKLHFLNVTGEGAIMRLFNKGGMWIAAAAALAALSSAAVSAADQTSYGRAGGAVGAGRIEQLAAVKASTETQTVDVSRWYGRAGGPVGTDRLAAVSKSKTYAAGQSKPPMVYGRAGVPLPFGG